MGKLFKWVLALVGVVVLLVLITAVVLPTVVDPNDYKDKVSAAVLKETGRELTIGGEIKWTVFPSLGLQLSDVTLGNREDFSDQPMLDIGDVSVSVQMMPLFSRKLEIGEVRLSDVSINLQRRADGQTNWGSFSDAPSGGTSKSPASIDFGSFVVSGIEISNANVTLEDAGQVTELKAFGLQASNIELGRPFDLNGGFSVNLQEQQLAGDVKFSGLVRSAADGARYGVERLELSFKGASGPAGDSLPLDMTITANADIDLAADQAKLSDFVLKLHDLLVTGHLDVASVLNGPEFAGQLKVPEFSPRSLMKAMGMEEPVTANPDAMTRLKADMNFSGAAGHANMQELTVGFDDSTFRGNLRIDGFEQPRLAFDFEIDRLNLDDYTPESAAEAGAAGGTEPQETDLTVQTFRGFTGGGDLRIGELVLAGMKATEVSTTMSSDGNGVRFYPVRAQFYGGQHEGDIRVDARGERPILTADLGLTAVQAEGLLTDLTGTASLLGVGDFFLKISTDLSNSHTTLGSLSGDLGMSVLDGAIVGIDVTETLGAVSSLMGTQKEAEGQGGQDQKTEFAELSMTGVFDSGIMTSNDLMMLSPLMQVTGEGSFNLVEESVDYVLKPVLADDTGVEHLDALGGTTVPIRLTGNLYEPDFTIDIAAALISSQKDVIEEKANEFLGGLLGGSNDKKKKKNKKKNKEGGG